MIAKATTTETTLAATGGETRIADNLITELPLRDVVWASLEKVSSKQKSKEPLEEGAKHVLSFDLQGLIDGHLFHQSIDAVVSVGHSQNRSSSVTPGVNELVAYLLSKLNRTTQQRLLADIPVDFAANACELPTVDPVLLASVKAMLGTLRSTCRVAVRAPVRCQFMAVE